MKVQYFGKRENLSPCAYISYDDENEKEFDKLDKIADMFEENTSYHIDIVGSGAAICEVDDKDDYKEFMQLWKEYKKEV